MTQKRPFLLLSNDDGIDAPGLKALEKSLREADLFDLAVIAPAREQSGTGVSITWDRPILIKQLAEQSWSIDGTPADCIKMGMSVILDRKPDLIVSGINAGSNAGRNVLHSGTIGAVIEGVLRGISGIALSCEDGKNPNFHVAQKYVVALIQYLLERPMAFGTFLNVNFPQCQNNHVKGIRLTKQGQGRWGEDPSLHMHTEHGPTYWLGGKPEEIVEDRDCDIYLLKQGYLTAVPIHIHELTDQRELRENKLIFEEFVGRDTPLEVSK